MKANSVILSLIFSALSLSIHAEDYEFKGKTLCVLGDSYVRNHKRPYSESWHARMAEDLGMNYVNFGRNGSSIAYDRTSDGFGPAMTVRYLEMPDTADYILVIAGHNDAEYVAKHGHWAKFEDGLDSLCSGLRAKYPSKPMGFVTPWGVNRPYFKAVINEIKSRCDKYGIPVLDVSDGKIIAVNDSNFRAKYFQGPNDTAHLNAQGHELMIEPGKEFFRNMVRNMVPRDTSFTAYSTNIKVRKHHPEVKLLPDSLPDGIKAYNNVVYTSLKDTPFGNRDLHVDLFRPDDNKVYPALIMIHGGGWNSGNKSLQVPMAQRIAARGYVTIPVEYRLIPEAKYPAGLHDIKTVVRWVRANADKFGIDPEKIALSGCSAGAHLATLVGVTNGSQRHDGDGEWRDVSSDVQAVINMDGIATFVSESNIEDANQRLATKGAMPVNAMWLGGMYDDAKPNWEEASALLWITDRSAPVCFINSALPRYSDGRDILVDKYKDLGIYTERHLIDVDVHPFWFFSPWVEPTIEYAVKFLDKTLKGKK